MPPKFYKIIENTNVAPEIYRLRLVPETGGEVISFLPGQFVSFRCATSPTPKSLHSFSIATSPNTRDYIETCYKVYGPWTQHLATLQPGAVLEMIGPNGRFVWDTTITNAVFLIGGVGATPMVSMLRWLVEEHQKPSIKMIYGNRTENVIAYRAEIEELMPQLADSKVSYVLSGTNVDSSWTGYRGYITQELIEKEGNLQAQPTFFLCGPPAFVEYIKHMLLDMGIDPLKIKYELFSSPPPPKGM